MNKLSLAFFGTHEYAAFILEGLLQCPFVEVTEVITQPDQPVGRKQILTPPEVKLVAQKYALPLSQPAKLKEFEFLSPNFDLTVVVEYGRIIPARLLSLPTYGTLNIHVSLLPKYRGATPIQFALLHGETKTGVTIMQMDAGMDTGPLLLQKEIAIDPDDTYPTLNKKLMPLGLSALLETIPQYVEGSLSPQTQDNAQATLSKILSREDGRADWTKTAEEIYNQYRAFTPWPGLWTTWKEKRLKLLEVRPSERKISVGKVSLQTGGVFIGTGSGSLEILRVQVEGKSMMDAKTFANGYKVIDESELL